jgi:hypothetical protein
MASDDAARLATIEAAGALQQCITDKMVVLQTIEKKAAKARTRVRAIALLLEEEQATAASLEVETTAAAQ